MSDDRRSGKRGHDPRLDVGQGRRGETYYSGSGGIVKGYHECSFGVVAPIYLAGYVVYSTTVAV